MALPPGWTQFVGTDVTDSDFNSSTVYIGDTSFEFKATAVATKIRSNYIEAPIGAALEISAVIRRTSGTGAFICQIEYYDAAKNLLTTVTNFTDSAMTNATWRAVRNLVSGGIANANRTRFIRVIVGKQSATAEQFFLGALDIRACRRAFNAVKQADQTVTTGSEDVVTWLQDRDYGEVFNPTNGAWDPDADNTASQHARKHSAAFATYWQFTARIYWDNLSDQERGSLFLVLNGSTYVAASEIRSSGGGHVTNQVSEILLMTEDDTLDVRASHSSGSSRVISATSVGGLAGTCSFSGMELLP